MPSVPCATPLPEPVAAVQWLAGERLASIVYERAASAGGGGGLPDPAHAEIATQRGALTEVAGEWIIAEASGHKHVLPDRYLTVWYAALDGQCGFFALQRPEE